MLRLYVDHNFHDQVTQGLRRRGVDCLTARDDGRRRASDRAILARATQLERVLVTHDNDFLPIASAWNKRGEEFAGIIYAHLLRVTIGRAIDDIELVVEAVPAEEIRNTVVRIPL